MLINRNKTALVYKGTKYSYTELLQYSLRYSQYFTKYSNNPQKILIFSENCPEYIFAIYATLRLGATVVPVDVTSTAKELRYIVVDSTPDLIVVQPEMLAFVRESISDIENFSAPIITPLDIEMSGASELPIIEIPMGDKDQIVSIIYTSGTTGSPKGVMLSYENYWYNIDAVVNQAPIFKEDSRVILLLPLHHVFAFAGALLAPMYSGGTVYIADSLAPESIIKTLQQGRISIIIGVPLLLDALAKGIMKKINASTLAKMLFKLAGVIGSQRFSKALFGSVHKKFGGNVEYFVSGGAALSVETGRVFKTLGLYVLEGYGMTECAPMIAFTHPGDRKVGYCGRLLKGLEMKFDDQTQEILVKGPNVMKGYYKREQETADILRDGWLHTGDVGELDKKGRLRITGRIKEIIVTPNGKNINPVEVEHAILADSQYINDVAVFLYEDMLQAIVLPDMDAIRANTGKSVEQSVRAQIEAYNNSSMGYKRIMNFHITSQELPKTRLGKIQRYKLKSLITQKEVAQIQEDTSLKSEVYLQLKQYIDSQMGCFANGNDHFEIDLSLDSLTRVSLMVYVEENFNVAIKESQMSELSTLNKLSFYVEQNATMHNEGNVSWKKIFEEEKLDIELPKSGAIHWSMHHISKVAFHLIYKFKSRGKENIPTVPCIFVANHRSGFDPVFITSKIKWGLVKNVFFFAKQKHFDSRAKRFMTKRNNIITMDINKNVRSSLQQMYQVLKQGKNVMIFPEGTRSKDAVMKEFKESFAILSKELNVPILPIAIVGSESAMWSGVRLPSFLSRISVEFLPVIKPSKNESFKELAKRVELAIRDKISH
ncbi:MAG: AMP-binding protein [Rikenellaceae bacterium]